MVCVCMYVCFNGTVLVCFYLDIVVDPSTSRDYLLQEKITNNLYLVMISRSV